MPRRTVGSIPSANLPPADHQLLQLRIQFHQVIFGPDQDGTTPRSSASFTAILGPWVSGGYEFGVDSRLLIEHSFIQRTGQVTFTGVGKDDDNRLSRIRRILRYAKRGHNGSTAGDAGENAFLLRKPPGHLD